MEECAEEMDTELSELSPTPAEMSLTPANPSLTPAEAFIHRQMQVAEAKEQIATLCTAVISSPQDNVMIYSCFVTFLSIGAILTLPHVGSDGGSGTSCYSALYCLLIMSQQETGRKIASTAVYNL